MYRSAFTFHDHDKILKGKLEAIIFCDIILEGNFGTGKD